MSALKRLAKLRQFRGGDAGEFLKTQHRQNMLALEAAIRELSQPSNQLTCQLSALTVPHGETAFFTFAYFVRSTNTNNIDSKTYLAKSNGNYLLEVNLSGVFIDGAKDVYFSLYKNGRELIPVPILLTDSTNNFTIPFSLILELELVGGDELTFGVSNAGSSTTDVTVQYGYLDIKQITQGV